MRHARGALHGDTPSERARPRCGSGDLEYGAHPPGEGDATAEIYDPRTGSWTLSASMLRERGWHGATHLNDGRVLVVGGFEGDMGPRTRPRYTTPDRITEVRLSRSSAGCEGGANSGNWFSLTQPKWLE